MHSKMPTIAYILLWFPKASETFIFREVMGLWDRGLPIKVYSLYGPKTGSLSSEMKAVSPLVERMGVSCLKDMLVDVHYWWKRNPEVTSWLFKTLPIRRWRNPEVGGENLWAFLAGFYLARRFEAEGIQHIHAPWANGPAMAGLVASKLTGISFSFAGKAHDICPPDDALKEKIAGSRFVVTNNANNIKLLGLYANGRSDKIHLVYNGITLRSFEEAPVSMKPPYQILAMGRFERCKGFDLLIRTAKVLDRQGMDFHVSIVGSGKQGPRLKFLTKRLGLSHRVSFPGFVSHDRVSEMFRSADMFVMPAVVDTYTGCRDGIPNVIMEAMLHRVPVISTNISGIAEVVVDGETGVVVSPGDVWDLVQAISHLTTDRKRALELAERGKARVLKQFDPARNYGRMLELFLEHVNGVNRSSTD
jgi:colanic acid/amylovoran biosynthesis glycosyltransferase